MSLVAYFFTSISSWPEQEDNQKQAEQTTKFNLEYEVYDKKGMYGADVISCLAKVQNNNEKYYDGGSFLSGFKYGEKYWINVYVKLNSDLEERIRVYHYDRETLNAADSGIYKQVERFNELKNPPNLGDIGFFIDESYTKLKATTPLKPYSDTLSYADDAKFININSYVNENGIPGGEITGNKYNAWLYNKKLEDGEYVVDIDSETPLQVLINTADSNLRQIVTNKGKPGESAEERKKSLEDWSSAEWITALYDFKTRRFKCDNIKYSDITGRVNEIYFSEI